MHWFAARSRDGRGVTLPVVNWSPEHSASLTDDFANPFHASALEGWRIHGLALDSTNVPGPPEQVCLLPLENLAPGPLSLSPHSINLYRFQR